MKNMFFACLMIGLVLLVGNTAVNAQGMAKPKPKVTAVPAPAKCGTNGLTADEIAEILAAHNHARAEHKLGHLTWDCKLADTAQEWANKGLFRHREDVLFGENLFVSSNSSEHISSVVAKWMGEMEHWTNKTGICAAGKICTLYTQIVWKTTARVGCGINRNATGKWKTLLVCNYSPAGNTPGPAY